MILAPVQPGIKADSAQPTRPAYARAAALDNTFWYAGHRFSVLADLNDTNGQFALIEGLTTHGEAPPPHLHSRELELFYILEGSATFHAGSQTRQVAPGSVVSLPPGMPHAFELPQSPVRYLLLLTPAGFEEFFRHFSVPALHLGAAEGGGYEMEVEELLQVGAEFGIQFLPPGVMPKDVDIAPEVLPAIIRHRGEGEVLNVTGIPTHIKISQEESGGAFSLFETWDARHLSGPPLHIHRHEDETLIVLEGEYRVQIGNEVVTATPGTLAHFPIGVPHTYQCVSEQGKLLGLTTPGGYEAFFRDVDAMMRTSGMSIPGLIHIAERHRVEVIGPPLA